MFVHRMNESCAYSLMFPFFVFVLVSMAFSAFGIFTHAATEHQRVALNPCIGYIMTALRAGGRLKGSCTCEKIHEAIRVFGIVS
ncbi:hypothetical protein F4808DRAFT_288926 [Astrocystis sublimbata]|nr:hypothetical protein F4808DRAFT_288926 [Astrocystis sublimbata]